MHYRGYTLYYGDAEAHLNLARRVVDSRTPGLSQIGPVWLPLPHLLMLPLVIFHQTQLMACSALAGRYANCAMLLADLAVVKPLRQRIAGGH